MRTFIYVGAGDGVPGLPREITDEQAKADGLTILLNQAIDAGVYVESSKANTPAAIESESKKSKKGVTANG